MLTNSYQDGRNSIYTPSNDHKHREMVDEDYRRGVRSRQPELRPMTQEELQRLVEALRQLFR